MATQRDVSGFLAEQQTKNTGEIAAEWSTMEQLYNKKLWHQLTLKLGEFVKRPCFQKGEELIELYNNFLSDFEHRINPLALLEILIYVVKQMKDPQTALEFMEKAKERVKSSEEATILCMTVIANVKLLQNDLPGTKKLVEEAQAVLDNIDGVGPVHGRFYELSSNYYKTIGNHAAYYRDALRYLGCTDLEDIPESEQVERAFNLSLAALLGKGVYNFGELLAHKVLESLKSTDRQWLVDLLYAFNSGNLEKFESLRKSWQGQADLVASEKFLRQKICLLCLMEMTFKRPANNRQLSFEAIAKEAKVPNDEVELLVMRALSLGLVKGHIDQVDKKVHMTWVQPRVLDLTQIGTMQQQLKHWCVDVNSMGLLVEDNAHDILYT
ncbi:26S proteasome non-ATPase regulatory subunit 13-like [Lineus longissimus]|uniref:26S proteasome non-ATPase regulatory subunit 13-like n=1 Tax=Lineus longissimus TaxID=88925 RepID=UPI002B4D72EE